MICAQLLAWIQQDACGNECGDLEKTVLEFQKQKQKQNRNKYKKKQNKTYATYTSM